jgi:multidrug resistance efflux pump
VTVWAVILMVTVAHEFGHGLTCKHFGGEVHELGFLLLLLQPCLYCNVSDSWLFPEKSKRLWVSFAGPYFELFLWALAVLIWRLTDSGTWINFVALAVTATSGVKALLNFNPLIKMDGYYLLSDWLGIHNLRRRSYACIGAGIKRLFGIKTPVDATPREKRIFLIYGLTASTFSFCALGYMVWVLAGFLEERNQGLNALFMVLFLIVAKIRRRLLRLFPEESKTWFKAIRRAFARMKRPAAALTLLAAMTAGAFLTRMELKVNGSFRVLPLHNADVRTGVEGIIEQVSVDEGDNVRKGDLIARLSDRDNLAELRKTQAAIEESAAKLRRLEAGARPEEIELAKATVAKVEERVAFAKSTVTRNQPLYEQKLLSQQDYEASEAALADRENELAEAKGKLAVLLAGSRPEDIDATKAEIARLEAQRGYLDEQVKLARVVSPASGIVATPSRELKEMVNKLVKKGDLIAKVFEMKTIEVETPISEKEIADVKVGQTVALKVRAFPDRTFYGQVTSIATTTSQSAAERKEAVPASADEFAGKTVLVTTRIDNSSLLLKPGMTGNAKILCGQHRIIDLITRRIARTFKVEFWSWW